MLVHDAYKMLDKSRSLLCYVLLFTWDLDLGDEVPSFLVGLCSYHTFFSPFISTCSDVSFCDEDRVPNYFFSLVWMLIAYLLAKITVSIDVEAEYLAYMLQCLV